jgi:uncharacterized protein (TIGR02145 family)
MIYSKETQRCGENNIVENKCGGDWYIPATHFCTKSESNPKVVPLCGGKGYDTKKKLCDARGEGKLYKYVEIGTQTWMAENLNYNASDSRCYNDSESNCTKYGRLYDWATAMDLNKDCNLNFCDTEILTQGICPFGWHIPNDDEWNVLFKYVDNDYNENERYKSVAGARLKTTDGWNWNSYTGNDCSGNGSDDHGFSALPSGMLYANQSEPEFYDIGTYTYWWSTSKNDTQKKYANYWFIGLDNHVFYGSGEYGEHKLNLYSVRCVKD